MKRILPIILLSVVCWGLRAQTLTLISPQGMEEPYEAAAGTSVTFRWTSTQPPDKFFTYTDSPVLDEYTVDTRWTPYANFTDNGNGTYDFTLPINSTLYVWGGAKFDFTGMWVYSNVIKVSVLSGVKVTATDGFLCPGTDSETLRVTGTYPNYLWYFNDEPITGATTATYAATEPGLYKVQVPLNGKSVFSNTLHVKTAAITMSGSVSGTTLTLKAAAGASSYQWLSGSSPSALSPIGAATLATYGATLNSTKVYYAVQATTNGCVVQSEARAANTAMFAKPVITPNVPTNSSGKTCDGTLVKLSVPDQYSKYLWYKDNVLYTEGAATLELYNGTGNYKVEVTIPEWPEITVTSDAKKVTYFSIKQPVVIGASNDTYCPGNTVTLALTDEGYTYTWYRHTDYNYTEADKIDVPDGEYTFTVGGSEYITIHASYLGCESVTTTYIHSYANGTLSPELSSYQPYFCPGTTVDAFVSDGDAGNYSRFQWYQLDGNNYSEIGGATDSRYTITEAGTYRVEAVPNGCPGVVITSDPVVLTDNSERPFFIESDQADICIGGQATLSVSDEWTSIQWLEKKIVMGESSGYDETYVPISGAGSGRTLAVTKFTGYVVKARHVDCSTGLKVTSQVFELKPRVNPTIAIEPDHEVSRWRKAPYDSIASYIYCDQAPLKLVLPQGYASYKWYSLAYKGDDNYVVGDVMTGASTSTIDLSAYGAIWYTAEVELDGCKGLSDPVLIDTYVHSAPAISSSNNSELCHLGDSTLLNNAFVTDNWVKYAWYKDDVLVPNSDNDTLYAKEPGAYYIVAYPEECPEIGYSSGIPVQVRFMDKAMIYENDTVIWATPWMGYYSYQWYANDKALTPEELPHIVHKNKMKSGEYIVEVTNPTGCTTTSDPFTWVITANEEDPDNDFTVYPNPTPGGFTITGLDARTVRSVNIYTTQGVPVYSSEAHGVLQFNLTSQAPGLYVVEAVLLNGTTKKAKVIRR